MQKINKKNIINKNIILDCKCEKRNRYQLCEVYTGQKKIFDV